MNVICFESCILYSSGPCNIVLRERQFPLAFYGGGAVSPGGDSHMKVMGMLVVSLRVVNCRFWFPLGC